MDDLLSINFLVDPKNIEENLFEIYKQIRPNAEKSKTIFKELKGGIMNLMYILYPKNDIKNAIVFRTFGSSFDEDFLKLTKKFKNQDLNNQNSDTSTQSNFKDLFFNRSSEALIMNSISEYGLCKPVYAKYLNGMCFGYAQGVTVDGPLMLTNDFSEQLSIKLAKFHSLKVKVPGIDSIPCYDKMFQQFSASVKILLNSIKLEIEKIKEYPFTEFPKLNQFISECEYLKEKFEKIGKGDIAFCHNDLNQKNVIWNPQERELFFIDFEISMNNYVAFEIGQIFFSFCGHFLDDFEKDFLPKESYRLKFIRKYLEEKYKLGNEKVDEITFEKEVQKLFIRSNVCILIFMMNAIVILIISEIKPETFNINNKMNLKNNLTYACGRYGLKVWEAYLKNKDRLLKPVDDYLKNENLN